MKCLVILNGDIDQFVKFPDLGIHLDKSSLIFNTLLYIAQNEVKVKKFLKSNEDNILKSIQCVLTAKHSSVMPSTRKKTPFQMFCKDMRPKLESLNEMKKSYVRKILSYMWRGPQCIHLNKFQMSIVKKYKLSHISEDEKTKFKKSNSFN